eukprot:TRINITY_DN61495_c0_g1_i2.p1 TRINITY_DN61495_c0_g1~~TRINITY_DN61495_c0_g1_i2.p1  ORF type:complete len:386 (-),score=49.38 TRINITY_DN61495_c0_g1_i2:237-1394(-)
MPAHPSTVPTAEAPAQSEPSAHPPSQRTIRAGLQLSVSRSERTIRAHASGLRCAEDAPVYLAAVVESLAAELLERSGDFALEDQRQIESRDISRVIIADAGLAEMVYGSEFREGLLPRQKHRSDTPGLFLGMQPREHRAEGEEEEFTEEELDEWWSDEEGGSDQSDREYDYLENWRFEDWNAFGKRYEDLDIHDEWRYCGHGPEVDDTELEDLDGVEPSAADFVRETSGWYEDDDEIGDGELAHPAGRADGHTRALDTTGTNLVDSCVLLRSSLNGREIASQGSLLAVLGSVHPGLTMGIAPEAMGMLQTLLQLTGDSLVGSALKLARHKNSNVLSCLGLKWGVTLWHPGELTKRAQSKGAEAVHKANVGSRMARMEARVTDLES